MLPVVTIFIHKHKQKFTQENSRQATQYQFKLLKGGVENTPPWYFEPYLSETTKII